MKYALILGLFAAPAFAECPAAIDYSAEIQTITDQMKVAPDEAAARVLTAQMWEIWLDAPDDLAQSMLDDGLDLIKVSEFTSSIARLSTLIEYCPDYAEGYNQRALAAFLSGNFDAALSDLDATLALQPEHLGARTGKAMTLIRLGRDDEAQTVLRDALAINPWLSERAFLVTPPGQDI